PRDPLNVDARTLRVHPFHVPAVDDRYPLGGATEVPALPRVQILQREADLIELSLRLHRRIYLMAGEHVTEDAEDAAVQAAGAESAPAIRDPDLRLTEVVQSQ